LALIFSLDEVTLNLLHGNSKEGARAGGDGRKNIKEFKRPG
jgi:hypothetical protein